MKLKIINPDSGMTQAQLQDRVAKLKEKARADTIISMECPVDNNIYIDSALDCALDAGALIQMALKAEREGYDAVALYCFSDPAAEACREALKIPVIGGGQASVLVAALLGHTFSILTTGAGRIAQKREFVRTTGVDHTRLVSVRSIDFSMEEQNMERSELADRLAAEAGKCAEDGAEAVVLGCLSFVGMSEEISRKAGIPVVDPAYALVSMAELVVAQGLTHSKKSYPEPPSRTRTWSGGSVTL